jgi:hypothetical protein
MPVAGHHGRSRAKSGQNTIEIGIKVGVVELDRSDGEEMGTVVEELRAAIEERGVVLVPLDDDVRSTPVPESAWIPQRKTTDQRGWILVSLLEDPGEHRRGGGLSVGAGYDQTLQPLSKHVMGDRFRLRDVGNPSLEDRGHLGVVSRHGVANDDPVDLVGKLLGIEADPHRDFELFEEGAHRRVEAGVDPFDPVAHGLEQPSQRSHCGASDRQKIEFLRCHV